VYFLIGANPFVFYTALSTNKTKLHSKIIDFEQVTKLSELKSLREINSTLINYAFCVNN
jgi:hypothetical protein